jgi:hypothetical protein
LRKKFQIAHFNLDDPILKYDKTEWDFLWESYWSIKLLIKP